MKPAAALAIMQSAKLNAASAIRNQAISSGSVRLWPHPSDWPETLGGRTRRVLTVALFGPLPPPRGEALALRRLAGAAVRTLAAPTAAGRGMCLMAWSGVAAGVTGFGAYRVCVLVVVTARTAVLPSARRPASALLCVGGGLALAAGQDLVTGVRAAPGPGSLSQALALGLPAAAALSTGRDLRRKSASVSAGAGHRHQRERGEERSLGERREPAQAPGLVDVSAVDGLPHVAPEAQDVVGLVDVAEDRRRGPYGLDGEPRLLGEPGEPASDGGVPHHL